MTPGYLGPPRHVLVSQRRVALQREALGRPPRLDQIHESDIEVLLCVAGGRMSRAQSGRDLFDRDDLLLPGVGLADIGHASKERGIADEEGVENLGGIKQTHEVEVKAGESLGSGPSIPLSKCAVLMVLPMPAAHVRTLLVVMPGEGNGQVEVFAPVARAVVAIAVWNSRAFGRRLHWPAPLQSRHGTVTCGGLRAGHFEAD